MRTWPRRMPALSATSAIFASGPTRIGRMRPFSPASIAPASAVSSHGCATAVGTGSRLRHLTSSCSYFPVPEVIVPSHRPSSRRLNRRPGLFQKKGEDDGDRDAHQERRERRLVVLELHL